MASALLPAVRAYSFEVWGLRPPAVKAKPFGRNKLGRVFADDSRRFAAPMNRCTVPRVLGLGLGPAGRPPSPTPQPPGPRSLSEATHSEPRVRNLVCNILPPGGGTISKIHIEIQWDAWPGWDMPSY